MFPQEEWQIVYYAAPNGRIPFLAWFELLPNRETQQIIHVRLARLRLGNFGKCEPVGRGVFELKIYYGPGYRIYFGRTAGKTVLLLCGGDKSSQAQDILKAQDYWQKFKKENP